MKPGGTKRGLRLVAAIEGIKGILVLIAAIGLPHHHTQHFLEKIVKHFHLNPARHTPGIFQHLQVDLSDAHLWALAAAAVAYAVVRLVEAYGLWFQRRWAEWLGCVGAGLYVPVELWHLIRHPSKITAVILLANLIVVLYLAACLRSGSRATAQNAPLSLSK